MIIYIKIGTHSAARMHLVRKRTPPEVGETFEVKERNERWEKPIQVRCNEIRDMGGEPLYFVECW